jgi:predicted nucleic acid-binding protein
MKYVIDSYAWIEYFMGTRMGETVKSLIENSEEKFTPTICLAEVYSKTLKVENQEFAEKQKAYIKEKSALMFLETIAVESARLNVKMRKELMDGF